MKSSTRPEIEELVHQVACRHDGFLARKVVITTIMAASSGSILGSLFWVVRGHSVPPVVPFGILVTSLLVGLIYGFARRMSPSAAVLEADRFFKLKDGISTARHLAAHAPEEPATALQWKWLSPRLADSRAKSISQNFPKRPAALAAALFLAAIVLGLLPRSATVRAAEIAASETRQRVSESKEELEKLIDALEKETSASEEKEDLKLDEFRKLVKAIDETGDRTEAVRQFARIEQKIRDSSRSLDQQRDEETLKLAANELAKAEETEARQLGKKIEAKELKEASEMLEMLAAKKPDDNDLKANKPKAISEAKQDLAKMRAASKRLAAAGKQRQAARQAQGGAGASSQSADGQMGGGSGEQGQQLEDLLAELDDNAAQAEKELEKIEFDPDAEPWDGECMQCANRALGKLGKHMRKMQGKRMAQSKLQQLCQALSQAQSQCQSQSQSQIAGQTPGSGKAPGTGSSWNERKERDDLQKNGSLAQLQGQHGAGPSLSAVEESDSGAGTSNRRGEAKEREFTRQIESFVQRDDVPESLKLGVRNYFENLQSPTKPEN